MPNAGLPQPPQFDITRLEIYGLERARDALGLGVYPDSSSLSTAMSNLDERVWDRARTKLLGENPNLQKKLEVDRDLGRLALLPAALIGPEVIHRFATDRYDPRVRGIWPFIKDRIQHRKDDIRYWLPPRDQYFAEPDPLQIQRQIAICVARPKGSNRSPDNDGMRLALLGEAPPDMGHHDTSLAVQPYAMHEVANLPFEDPIISNRLLGLIAVQSLYAFEGLFRRNRTLKPDVYEVNQLIMTYVGTYITANETLQNVDPPLSQSIRSRSYLDAIKAKLTDLAKMKPMWPE